MTAGRNNLTRRALLGVAFAAPVILGDCTNHPAAAAPDLPALAMKIELAVDHQVWNCDSCDRYMVVPEADG